MPEGLTRAEALRQEEGMAWRLFCAATGTEPPNAPFVCGLTDDELLEEAWADRGAFD